MGKLLGKSALTATLCGLIFFVVIAYPRLSDADEMWWIVAVMLSFPYICGVFMGYLFGYLNGKRDGSK